MPKAQIQSGDTVHTVEFRQVSGGPLLATVDGQTIEMDLKNSGSGGLLRIGHRVIPFFSARNGEDIEVWMDGIIHRFQRVGGKGRSRAGEDAQLAAEILAPMPGTILRINVEKGGTFAAHQPLIIMESMKMEITLSSPQPGHVGELHCNVGELVPMGRLLARLEPLKVDATLSTKS